MRILFLCSGLEPGRDAVGDYVRLLAAECVGLGHSCAILALHDRFIGKTDESFIAAGREKISVLRLPSTLSWPGRAPAAAAFRDRFQPGWISFQVVPYGFQAKGLVRDLNPFFQALTAGCPLHVAFHELWIGGAIFAPVRERLIGALQRRGVRQMTERLQPRLVTTSTPFFVAMLDRIGVRAELLPLFGNVPVAPVEDAAPLPAALVEAGVSQESRAGWWLAIFFGSLHPQWKPEPFMGRLRRAARRAHKRVALLLVGRAGTTGLAAWDQLRRDYRSDFVCVNFGEQSPDVISRLLQSADFGVAASPWGLVGKSGTVAAMLDHGLPVIVTRDDFRPLIPVNEPQAADPLLYRCDADLESKLVAGLPRRSPHPRLAEVAARLVRRMRAISDDLP